jgi:hypothetical protein
VLGQQRLKRRQLAKALCCVRTIRRCRQAAANGLQQSANLLRRLERRQHAPRHAGRRHATPQPLQRARGAYCGGLLCCELQQARQASLRCGRAALIDDKWQQLHRCAHQRRVCRPALLQLASAAEGDRQRAQARRGVIAAKCCCHGCDGLDCRVLMQEEVKIVWQILCQ